MRLNIKSRPLRLTVSTLIEEVRAILPRRYQRFIDDGRCRMLGTFTERGYLVFRIEAFTNKNDKVYIGLLPDKFGGEVRVLGSKIDWREYSEAKQMQLTVGAMALRSQELHGKMLRVKRYSEWLGKRKT